MTISLPQHGVEFACGNDLDMWFEESKVPIDQALAISINLNGAELALLLELLNNPQIEEPVTRVLDFLFPQSIPS